MHLNRVQTVNDHQPVRNAIISVADKTGLPELLTGLWRIAPELTVYSTGGTFNRSREIASASGNRSKVKEISSYTGQPEMDGGLVKTLDWKIYLGLLAEDFNTAHTADLARAAAVTFDLVVCNFYPFRDAVSESGHTLEDARGNIDIGGPAMVRAAAKNFLRVATLSHPDQYDSFLTELHETGYTTVSQRFALAKSAFKTVADYDQAITSYLDQVEPERLSVYEIRKGYENG